MSAQVKICGVNDPESLSAAIKAGADYVGFVFYPSSPRALKAEIAQKLAFRVPAHMTATGLFVDPNDDKLYTVTQNVPLDLIQLHGKETPQRVAQIRNFTGKPVMKAIAIASAADLDQASSYEEVADMLLFDAKPPKGSTRPGGNAQSFDWSLLRGRKFTKPWLLAGGLNAQNLGEAVRLSGARGVDISSGVEDRPGHKSPAKIHEFIELAGRL